MGDQFVWQQNKDAESAKGKPEKGPLANGCYSNHIRATGATYGAAKQVNSKKKLTLEDRLLPIDGERPRRESRKAKAIAATPKVLAVSSNASYES